MIFIAGTILGALTGGLSARRRGGSGFDIAQYALVGGLIGLVLGLALTVVIDRIV